MKKSELRGPSWSWASVDGETSMPDLDFLHFESPTILAHISDAEVTPVTGDAFGHIKGGKIRILGSLGVIRLPITDDGSTMARADVASKRLQDQETKIAISWDTLEMASLLDPRRQNLFTEMWGYIPVRKYETSNVLPSSPQPYPPKRNVGTSIALIRDVFYLPLTTKGSHPFSRYLGPRKLYGLLLIPTRKQRGEFRRAGQFEARYDETSVEAMKRSTATLSPEYFESADGQTQYTITII